jgi:hypothetical protein
VEVGALGGVAIAAHQGHATREDQYLFTGGSEESLFCEREEVQISLSRPLRVGLRATQRWVAPILENST